MLSVRGLGTPLLDGLDQAVHRLPALRPVGFAVGDDHLLLDIPGRLDFYVRVVGEQSFQLVLLLVGEQAGDCPRYRYDYALCLTHGLWSAATCCFER